MRNKLQMSLSGTVLQICLRFAHEGRYDKKTDCKSVLKRIIMIFELLVPVKRFFVLLLYDDVLLPAVDLVL